LTIVVVTIREMKEITFSHCMICKRYSLRDAVLSHFVLSQRWNVSRQPTSQRPSRT
jgi:hypothetical protein